VSQDDASSSNLHSLMAAQKLLDDGQLEACLLSVKEYWLKHPEDAEAAALLGRVMNEAGRINLSEKLERLSKTLHCEQNKTSATSTSASNEPVEGSDLAHDLFETSHALIDVRLHDLAVMLLERCIKYHPNEPVINYELGFSLMSLGKFHQATKHFEKAGEKEKDFDTTLNLAVCYSLTRRIEEARNMLKCLEDLAQEDDEKKELAHRKTVLKRLERMQNKSVFTHRDWLYILYGSILLRPQLELGSTVEGPQKIAMTLALLKGLFQGLRVDVEIVEYYSTYSRPLAKMLAELLSISSDSYKGPNRPERTLLVMSWAADIIGPHRSFMENNYQRLLFAYGLPMSEPLPVTPDVVGAFIQELHMPWSENVQKGTNSDQVLESIVCKAQALETDPDFINQIEELVNYYDERRELLVLGNSSVFPERPEYSAEVHESVQLEIPSV
jgi:tetratricopeptide (TPR) repeat protein